MRTGYLGELEKAIRLKFICTAIHRQTVSVHEKTEDEETVWSGDVEVFDLIGCNEANRCYAWHDGKDRVRVVTVLHSRLVDSARRAVQAAIFMGVQLPMLAPAELETIMETMRHTAASISPKWQ